MHVLAAIEYNLGIQLRCQAEARGVKQKQFILNRSSYSGHDHSVTHPYMYMPYMAWSGTSRIFLIFLLSDNFMEKYFRNAILRSMSL